MRKLVLDIMAALFSLLSGVGFMVAFGLSLSFFAGGWERVQRFFAASSGKDIGFIGWLSIVLGASLGIPIGVIIWSSVMQKLGFLEKGQLWEFFKR